MKIASIELSEKLVPFVDRGNRAVSTFSAYLGKFLLLSFQLDTKVCFIIMVKGTVKSLEEGTMSLFKRFFGSGGCCDLDANEPISRSINLILTGPNRVL